MNLRTLLVTAALVFVVSGVARAAELSTATMFTAGSHYVVCGIVNVSSTSQTVRIRIYNLNGGVISDSGDLVLPARATEWSSTFFGAGHCRFTTVGAKTLFRASISVYDGGNVIASTPAQ
jgi:hypothetical protein